MTDEAFWIRIETDVVPHVEKNHSEHLRYFMEKLDRVKNCDEKTEALLFHHEWISLGQNLSNFYLYEGMTEIKMLIEHCCTKGGRDLPKHLL
jgi:hypothetical protein